MDKEQAINLAKRYKEMVAEKLPLKALYLYGSYSKGNYRADSDIDIAVIVERLDDDYFKDTPLLWKLLAKVSAACAADNANIVEVTQSVLQDMFAMVMLIEFNEDKIDFEKLRTDLDAVGEATATKIHVMHEDIFNSMHRI